MQFYVCEEVLTAFEMNLHGHVALQTMGLGEHACMFDRCFSTPEWIAKTNHYNNWIRKLVTTAAGGAAS